MCFLKRGCVNLQQGRNWKHVEKTPSVAFLLALGTTFGSRASSPFLKMCCQGIQEDNVWIKCMWGKQRDVQWVCKGPFRVFKIERLGRCGDGLRLSSIVTEAEGPSHSPAPTLPRHGRKGQECGMDWSLHACVQACMLSCFNHVRLFATLWTVASRLLCL